MYPRPLLGTIKGKAREWIQDTRNNTTRKPYAVERTHSIPIHTTLVFTPVQALRCRIIQTLLPLDVGPSLAPNQDKSLCLFASPSGKGSTHTSLLVGVTLGGKHRQGGREGGGGAGQAPVDQLRPATQAGGAAGAVAMAVAPVALLASEKERGRGIDETRERRYFCWCTIEGE